MMDDVLLADVFVWVQRHTYAVHDDAEGLPCAWTGLWQQVQFVTCWVLRHNGVMMCCRYQHVCATTSREWQGAVLT